ncbi:MAG: dihydrodipicolinate reductase [Deltaproteobacteria bacterium]|nr:MAG: dihydrodipicolinate reductase [Deltaproteobacteria bacterium]
MPLSNRLPVIVQGLGPMGLRVLAGAIAAPALAVVGAVDCDQRIAGRTLGSLIPGAGPTVVARDLPTAAANAPPGTVVLQGIGSFLAQVAPAIEEAVDLGLSVVSTCEELAWPFARHPALSEALDARARAAGVTVVGTGVNPGFLMDRLVVTLRAAVHAVRAIRVERVQDPRPRRVPFQRKVGMGLSREEWDAAAARPGFGHAGLEESARIVAAGFGWDIPRFEETLEPFQADPAGPVLGVVQEVRGETADGRRLSLHFAAHSGVSASYDRIAIDGMPPITMRFEGGVFGDDATVSAVLAAAQVMPHTRRGLVTVLDLPLR